MLSGKWDRPCGDSFILQESFCFYWQYVTMETTTNCVEITSTQTRWSDNGPVLVTLYLDRLQQWSPVTIHTCSVKFCAVWKVYAVKFTCLQHPASLNPNPTTPCCSQFSTLQSNASVALTSQPGQFDSQQLSAFRFPLFLPHNIIMWCFINAYYLCLPLVNS